MLEVQCKVYAAMLALGRQILADIDADRFCVQPAPGLNHPAWILGHLAVVSDGTIRLLGESRVLPREWGKLFGPGTNPSTDPALYPSKDELVAAWTTAHERMETAAAKATAELLAEPHGVDFANLKVTLPTKGDLVTHVMTSHEGFHLGQLSTWRRLAGMPYLF
ncbi:MAG: DinB family protein [Isosphaeraceae bacterium]